MNFYDMINIADKEMFRKIMRRKIALTGTLTDTRWQTSWRRLS